MVRTRFAPSPTGYLHIGGLRTALYAYLFAKQKGGKFILRLEDTDQQRLVKDADKIIYSTLKDAGLLYDEGPDVGGAYGPYIQSQRKAIYLELAKQLVERGGAYYCFCTKERLEGLHKDGIGKYDKHCLTLSKEEIDQRLSQNQPYVIRQNLPTQGTTEYNDLVFGDIRVDFKELEDNVLIKSDGLPTYNFANVVDDKLMGINYVMRGIEYLSSTPKYNHIYDTMGWERPKYIHLQPIMKDASQKLSKRHGAASYQDFINKGYLSPAIINYIALLGWSPKDNTEKLSLSDLLCKFSLDGVSKSPSIFDEAKMRYINSLYIKELNANEFHKCALPFYCRLDYLLGYDWEFLSRLLHSRTEVLCDIENLTQFLTEFDDFDLSLLENQKWKTDCDLAKAMLSSLIDLVQAIPDSDDWADSLDTLFAAFAEKNGYKKGQVLWIFRIAITGAKNTPGGASEMAKLLKRKIVLQRLNKTLSRLK